MISTPDSSVRTVTVFGGTGFLGRRIAEHLLDHDFAVRIAARHPSRASGSGIPVKADIHNPEEVASAVAGAWGVVNAVSLYVEKGADTFERVHVKAAGRLAAQARQAGVAHFVQISGIGVDPNSPSAYVRSRAEGERAVLDAFPMATIVRPSAMFGEEGGLLASIAEPLRKFPVFPLFGTGRTRLQPVSADDVGEAVSRIIGLPSPVPIYELGGPRVVEYAALVERTARSLGLRRVLLPVPFGLWHGLATVTELLPHPPLSRGQVALMEHDNVVSNDHAGFADLGMAARDIDTALSRQSART